MVNERPQHETALSLSTSSNRDSNYLVIGVDNDRSRVTIEREVLSRRVTDDLELNRRVGPMPG